MAKGEARAFLLRDLAPLAAGDNPAGAPSNFTPSVPSVVLTSMLRH